MSNWREQLSEESETKAMVAWLEDYYHVPVLIVLVGFVLWNRLRNYGNFIVDGTVYLSGNDPWYHLRMTEYTVNNFPSTMAFDPWTHFPHGTSPEQFGTLFDQIIALVALIVGLGSPSESLIRQIFLVAPPFFAVLVCIPGYFIGKRVGGRVGGLIVVATIALMPDRLLSVTLAGNVQHHVLEVLFMSLSVLGVMVALSYAEREKPVFELVQVREFDAMRGTIGYSMLAGVAMAMYIWTWPPAMWIFGILSIFFVVHMSLEHVRGRSPEHSAFVGVISMTTAGILALSTVRSLELTGVTSRSLLQPGLAFAAAAGVLFLAVLSRELDRRDLSRVSYPATVAGSLVITLGLMALLTPGLFDFLTGQVDRVFGFVTSPGTAAGTIGEAQPMEFSQLRDTYQLALFTGGIGGAILLVKQFIDSEPKGEELLIVLWSVMMVLATLTQLRFAYYMTIVVGALNAALIGYLFELTGGPSREFEFETYQVLTIAVIVLVMFAPLLGLPIISADTTATQAASDQSFPGDVVAWDDSLQYMNENTPEAGQFGHPDNEPMELFGSFEETDDFDYPDGAYGVMSWWDYGHWITERGERIPNANPFQEGASSAAEFLLAQDEDEALEALSEVDDHDEAQTRFVMIDWRMVETETAPPVRGKFFAPPQFHDEYEEHEFTTQLMNEGEQGQLQPLARIHKQPYYNSMMTRLYHFHGSAESPEPVVVEWTGQEQPLTEDGDRTFVQAPPDEQQSVQTFPSMAEAQEYVEENPNAQIGGIGAMPSERVEGLEHFRLVHLSETSAIPQTTEDQEMRNYGVNLAMQLVFQQNVQNTGFGNAIAQDLAAAEDVSTEEAQEQASMRALDMMYPTTPSFTKTFERVPGATIEGTGPENDLIQVTVELDPENGQPFTYERQVMTDDDGNFELVVPYATTGYDEYGVEEGYTEPALEATTEYEIRAAAPEQTEEDELFTWEATANVTEAQVIGEDPEPVTVELEREELDFDLPGEDEEEGEDEQAEEEEQSEEGADEEEQTSDDDEGSDDGDDETESITQPVGVVDTLIHATG